MDKLPNDLTDQLETAILNALDETIARITGDPKATGWNDAELKVLLPAIRKHSQSLFIRYNEKGQP